MIAFAPALHAMRPRHWLAASLLAVALAGFAYLLWQFADRFGQKFGPRLQEIEQGAPR